MDRKLLTSAIFLLAIEFVILFADLGIINVSMLSPFTTKSTQPVIGVLEQKRYDVKRKSQNSLVWEESKAQDNLKAYDSILTLNESSALIKLEGNIKVDLHENTLVVLEPLQAKDKDHPFRLKFFDGRMAAKTPTHRLMVGTEGWTIEAKEGTEFSLKKNSQSKIEVDVTKGTALLTNKNLPGENKTLNSNTRIQLEKDRVLSETHLDTQAKLVLSEKAKVYSHTFPIQYKLSWKGEVTKLVHWHNKKIKEYDISDSKTPHILLSLAPGSHIFSLKTPFGVSSEKTLHVWTAPRIRYFSPLPRNRVRLNTQSEFTWTPVEGSHKYKLQIHSKDKKQIYSGYMSETPFTEVPFKEEGQFYWSVSAEDKEGNEIPAYYLYPIHAVDNPLAAPKLKKPGYRTPANKATPLDNRSPDKSIRKPQAKEKTSHNSSSSLLESLWTFLFPRASAEQAGFLLRSLVFSWHSVDEADYYIIEISETPDFANPIVNKKVSKAEFKWAQYKKRDYYWRVAAGKKSGKMGLFSEPTYVDLSSLGELENGTVTQGVLVEVKTTPKLPKALDQAGTKVKKSAEPAKQVTRTGDLNTAQKNILPEQTRTQKTVVNHAGRFRLFSSYTFIKQSNEKNIKAELSGLQPFGGHYTHEASWKGQSLVIDLLLSKGNWKPKNSDKQPFQERLSPLNYSISVGHKALDSPWLFSLNAHTLARLKRKGLEEVEVDNTTLAGLQVSHIKLSNGQSLTHKGLISLGQGISEFTYGFDYVIPTPWKSSWSLGASFNLRYFSNGEKFEGHSVETIFSISKPW